MFTEGVCRMQEQCAISKNMPAKRPKRKLKKPPLRQMSGEELRKWRLKHDLSQAELAELLGVSQNTISQWENGVRQMPVYMPLLLLFLEQNGFVNQ